MSNTNHAAFLAHLDAACNGAIASLLVLSVAGLIAAAPKILNHSPETTHEIRKVSLAIAATGIGILLVNLVTLAQRLINLS